MSTQILRNKLSPAATPGLPGILLVAVCVLGSPLQTAAAQDPITATGIGLPAVPAPGIVSETNPDFDSEATTDDTSLAGAAGRAGGDTEAGASPAAASSATAEVLPESEAAQPVPDNGAADHRDAGAPVLDEAQDASPGDAGNENDEPARVRLRLPPDAAGDPDRMRLAAYEAFVSFYENDDHENAQEAGSLVVEFTAAQYGPDSLEMVTPLANLAVIQLELDRLGEAQENYEHAIRIVETADSIFSPLLVSPLMGLGLTQRKAGDYETSISTLQRAKNITHRNQGLMNLEQIDIVEMLTESYMGAREFRDADREQRFALMVNERRFGPESPDLVPALYRLADWFKRTGQYVPARNIYRRSLEILENHHGENDLRLTEALRGVAVTYHLQGVRRSEGARALQRAVSLYEEAPSVDALDHAGALVSLGDWYIQTGKNRQAVETYQQAWQLLTDEDGGSTDRASGVLGVPVRLRYYPPQPESGPASWSAEDFASRFVDVEFTVTERGRVVEAQVVSANAPNRVKQQVRQAVLNARYRPRFVEGEAVETPGVRLRQTFFSSD